MIGRIIGIENNTVIIKLSIDLEKTPNIANLYVSITDK